jgi:hypothetical protein
MAELQSADTLREALRTAWHLYIDMLVPLRPTLHTQCRGLTGNLWDAEDLVQDTLLRAFGRWGVTYPAIQDPLTYLLRAATDEWSRRRGPLPESETAVAPRRVVPSPELVDRFVALYDAHDVAGLVALMCHDGTAENVGNSFHGGCDHASEGLPHFFYKVVHGHEEWPRQTWPDAVRIERVELDGEPMVVLFATRWGSEALEVVFRFEEQAGQIARIRAYGFCPETVGAVGEALGLPVRTGLYRCPTPAPGVDWPAALEAGTNAVA